MNKTHASQKPADPRDKGGRNESGQNPDTQIELGQQIESESNAELQAKLKSGQPDSAPSRPR